MTRRKKTKPRKRRNAVAKDLYTPKYRPRVVKLKTLYSRKKKPEIQEEGEA